MYQVALLIETSRAYGRGLLRGAARFIGECAGWSTYFQPQGLGDPPPEWLKDWRGDGILARIEDRRMADAILATGLPAVNLRGTLPDLPVPFLGLDNCRVAEMAAEHLMERGFQRFAFVGLPEGVHPGMTERAHHFRRIIEESGRPCSVYPAQPHRGNRAAWEQQQARLAAWIRSLPKPVGVMACHDDRGIQVLDACRRTGTRVPDEVAVVSVDNDEFLCGLSIPPLSSIDVNSEQIGYEAAALLDGMMHGRKPPGQLPQIAPRGVVTRRSTDVLATDDEDVIAATRYIREHACEEIRVADVLTHVNVSRASLEPRMRRILGHTIYREIERVRLERVKELLASSHLSIKQVSHATGFHSVQYLTRTFRPRTGTTPARYRSQMRQ